MKPNFLIFMTDHQRGDTINENNKVFTPNIDKIRDDCIEFTNARCPSPHCCPSRASFFTGLYPTDHGVWNNVEVSNTLSRGLYDNVKCFSSDLKENGYNMYFSGKWHVSNVEGPDKHGFELLFHPHKYRNYPNEVECSEWTSQYGNENNIDKGNEIREEAQIIREGYPKYFQYGINETPYNDEKVVNAAEQKIKELENTDTPFMIYAGVLGPHDPYKVPQRFLDMYKDVNLELPPSFDDDMEDKPALYRRTKANYNQLTRREQLESLRHFYAFCTYEDYLFGRLVDALKTSGLYDSTIIMYMSDHGDYIGSHGLWAKGLPCFSEAYHVCSLIGGGYFKKAGFKSAVKDDTLINLTDFAPTFLDLAGIKPNRRFEGSSLVPLFKGDHSKVRKDFFTQSNGNEVYGIQRSVTSGKWKYVFNSFDFDELYDLENDPLEMHNLIYCPHPQDTKYRDIVRMMCKKMWKFAYENHDTCVNGYIMTAMAPFGPAIIKNSEDF